VTAIIELLERYLAAAKADRLTGIAISATVPMGKYQHHFAGDVPAEPAQLKSVLELADKLQWSVDNWQPLATDWSLDESYAFYHCGLAPNGIDFLTWLLANEMTRVDAGAPGPLKVAFWQGHTPLFQNP
jgi:hypothetical protein